MQRSFFCGLVTFLPKVAGFLNAVADMEYTQKFCS